jgi:hypothetical protein
MSEDKLTKQKKKNGIPTGNADEYFVMGELLRRGSMRNSQIATLRDTICSRASR